MISNVNLTQAQTNAVKKLSKVKVGALFMEPGTGKTLTALRLIESTNADFVLFMVAFQTKGNLQAEIDKWGLSKKYRIEGIESLSNSDRLYLDLLAQCHCYHHVFMVVDESIKIKNDDAIRTQRCLTIGKLTEYRLILNGTPVTKNIMDLWTQMYFLSSKILNMGNNCFEDTFVEYIDYRYYDSHKRIIKKYHNLEYLYSLIDPFVFDAKLNLSINQQQIETKYELSAASMENYQSIKGWYLTRWGNWDIENIFLAMTQRLQQAYCIDDNKLLILDALLKKINMAKTIVFCKFVQSKSYLQSKYPELHILTYGKGALGLNLQQFHTIIFFDKTFDYAQKDQAEYRVYRIGQNEDVTYYNFSGQVGLDKMIGENNDKKINLLETFKKLSVTAQKKKIEAL